MNENSSAIVRFYDCYNDPYRDQSPLAVGESVTVEGVTITVLESTEMSDTVQVTVEQQYP